MRWMQKCLLFILLLRNTHHIADRHGGLRLLQAKYLNQPQDRLSLNLMGWTILKTRLTIVFFHLDFLLNHYCHRHLVHLQHYTCSHKLRLEELHELILVRVVLTLHLHDMKILYLHTFLHRVNHKHH